MTTASVDAYVLEEEGYAVVRAVFVILALVTHGAWLLVYLVLLFVIPI